MHSIVSLNGVSAPMLKLVSLKLLALSSVEASSTHTKLHCWGVSGYVKSDNVPSDVLWNATDLSAALDEICAIKDGALRCWGKCFNWKCQFPTSGVGRALNVRMGSNNVCAQFETIAPAAPGTVLKCWGNPDQGVPTVPTALEYNTLQYSLGGGHACAVDNGNNAVCWGQDHMGQATVPSDLGTVNEVHGSWAFTCAITTSGVVRCWGDDRASTNVPRNPVFPGPAQKLDGGYTYICASYTENGGLSADCVGNMGNNVPQGLASRSKGVLKAFAAGGSGSCFAINDRDIVCRGSDGWCGTTPYLDHPMLKLATGNKFTCGLEDWTADVAATTVANPDNELVCWGDATTVTSNSVPQAVRYNAKEVSAGNEVACAVSADGQVSCWGCCEKGECYVPEDVGAVRQLSVGDACLICAIFETAPPAAAGTTVRCWGCNNNGAHTIPAAHDSTAVEISTGGHHVCVVDSNKVPGCWGLDNYLQATIPGDVSTVEQIEAAWSWTCVITTPSHALRCWGGSRFSIPDNPTMGGPVLFAGAGVDYVCAVVETASGENFECVGQTTNAGSLSAPAETVGSARLVSGSQTDMCFVHGLSGVVCQGGSPWASLTPTFAYPISMIATGQGFSCAILELTTTTTTSTSSTSTSTASSTSTSSTSVSTTSTSTTSITSTTTTVTSSSSSSSSSSTSLSSTSTTTGTSTSSTSITGTSTTSITSSSSTSQSSTSTSSTSVTATSTTTSISSSSSTSQSSTGTTVTTSTSTMSVTATSTTTISSTSTVTSSTTSTTTSISSSSSTSQSSTDTTSTSSTSVTATSTTTISSTSTVTSSTTSTFSSSATSTTSATSTSSSTLSFTSTTTVSTSTSVSSTTGTSTDSSTTTRSTSLSVSSSTTGTYSTSSSVSSSSTATSTASSTSSLSQTSSSTPTSSSSVSTSSTQSSTDTGTVSASTTSIGNTITSTSTLSSTSTASMSMGTSSSTLSSTSTASSITTLSTITSTASTTASTSTTGTLTTATQSTTVNSTSSRSTTTNDHTSITTSSASTPGVSSTGTIMASATTLISSIAETTAVSSTTSDAIAGGTTTAAVTSNRATPTVASVSTSRSGDLGDGETTTRAVAASADGTTTDAASATTAVPQAKVVAPIGTTAAPGLVVTTTRTSTSAILKQPERTTAFQAASTVADATSSATTSTDVASTTAAGAAFVVAKVQEETIAAIANVLTEVEAEVDTLLEDFSESNRTTIFSNVTGGVLAATKLDFAAFSSSNGSGDGLGDYFSITVSRSVGEASPAGEATRKVETEVRVPRSLYESLRQDLAIDDGLVLTVTSFDEGGESSPVVAMSSRDEESGSFVEVKAAVAIDLSTLRGKHVEVGNLTQPITFSMPVTYTKGMLCAFWDEHKKLWSTDGVSVNEKAVTDGALICDTWHLSLFGAIFQGFLDALLCSQLTLFNSKAFKEMLYGDWKTSPGSLLFWLLLTIMASVFAVATYIDWQRDKRFNWSPEFFLLPRDARNSVLAAPEPLPTVVEEEEEGTEELHIHKGFLYCIIAKVIACVAVWCACCRENALRDAVDEIVSEWFENFGELRTLGESIWDSLEIGAISAGRFCHMSKTVMSRLVLTSSRRLAAASMGVNGHVVNFVLDDQEMRGILMERHARRSEEIRRSAMTRREQAVARAAGAVTPKTSEETAEISLRRRDWRLCTTRNDAWAALHEEVCDQIEKHVSRVGWWALPYKVWVIFRAHNPLGSIFAHNIFMSCKMTAFMRILELTGELMVVCIFFDASGSASPKDNGEECGGGELSETMGYKLGRILAIATGSILFAGLPVTLLHSLHTRHFKHFDTEGCPQWKRQLKAWKIQDMVIWVAGSGYLAFAVLFICLFLANIGIDDHTEWTETGAFTLFQDAVVVPLSVALIMPMLCSILITCISVAAHVDQTSLIREVHHRLHESTNVMLPIVMI